MYHEALNEVESHEQEPAFRDPLDYAAALSTAATERQVAVVRSLAAAPPKYRAKPYNDAWQCLNCESVLHEAKPFCDSECCREYDEYLTKRSN